MRARIHLTLSTLALLAGAVGIASVEPTWKRWDTGLREAASANKPVIVDVYTDWCGWCKRMDRDVYARNDVRDYLQKHFVTVKLDAESPASATYLQRRYTEQTLASRFRVTGYPTTLFLRSDGEHLVNVPGYIPADRFLSLLRYIGEGHFEKGVPFDEFTKRSPRGR